MLKNDMIIDELYVSDKGFDMVTAQSCDCEKILIKSGELSYLISHRSEDGEGYIEIKSTDIINLKDFTYKVHLGDATYKFDKIQTLDNGYVDGIRFRSEKLFLFVFSLEDNLVLTQTTYDLFDESDTDLTSQEDEPLLQIKNDEQRGQAEGIRIYVENK